MTERVDTVLSVRGDARLDVPPDLATLSCAVQADERDKAAALRTVAARLDAVLVDLRELGGTVLTAGAGHLPLGWSAHSASSYVESRWDEREERDVPTGRVIASVALRIDVRDFALMDRLGAALAAHAAVQVGHVQWSVDADNPAWPQVRAAAIEAAIGKGRDYATALGGSLERIVHVADAGLLGGDGPREMSGFAMYARGAQLDSSAGSAPSLDPVPQELQAVIEARFAASVRPLA